MLYTQMTGHKFSWTGYIEDSKNKSTEIVEVKSVHKTDGMDAPVVWYATVDIDGSDFDLPCDELEEIEGETYPE